MKWFILLLFVLAFMAGYSPQLRTRYQPLPAVARRWALALVFPRTAIRLEVIRR